MGVKHLKTSLGVTHRCLVSDAWCLFDGTDRLVSSPSMLDYNELPFAVLLVW